MTALWEMLPPAGVFVYCLNAALASLVACGLAVLLSRLSTWSLPLRHALLVVALVVSLVAPLVIPLCGVPAIWAIRVAEVPDRPPAPLAAQPAAVIHDEPAQASPVVNDVPRAEANLDRPVIAEPAVNVPLAAESDVNPPTAPVPERPLAAKTDWARLAGTLICGTWLAGILVAVGRGVFCLARLKRWMQTVCRADGPVLLTAAREAAAGAGLRGDIPLYCSSLLPAPVTFGLIRPRVVVPEGIESQLPPDQLRAVILHEMAHLARRDLWIGLLQQIAQIVYWWNPLVRLASRQISELREQICDDIAVSGLPEPSSYAATLLDIAERCSLCAAVPATLGIGASPAGQLESRIRRLVSSPSTRCVRLSRRAAAGVSAAAIVMAATILFAQVQIKSPAAAPPANKAEAEQAKTPDETSKPAAAQPAVKKGDEPELSLHDLIQQMAVYERMYLPFDIKSLETFRFPDDLTPQEKARNLRADGRKHQKLMEYAQVERRIWRTKETSLVDDEVEQGPYDSYSDGERNIQVSPSPTVINGVKTLEYYVNNRKNQISNYQHATPLCGIFCLSSFGNGELFSQAFKDEEGVELAWDKGDAKLTFGYGKPSWNTKLVLWLSREHAWHPIRLQRFWDAKDELFFDEWEVTKFVQRGKVWRVAEGTHRYRDLKGRKVVDPKIKYSMDFKVLEEKYGSAVDEKQFQFTIPEGAKVRTEGQPEAEPPPPAKTREITVTVVDVAGKPIPKATVRLPRWRFSDLDLVTTDEQGIARSAKAPVDDVSVQITAPGYRPVSWIMGDVNQLHAIMTPVSPGVVVDRGKPAADAWITNKSLQIRADGYAYVPNPEWDGKDEDWSDDAGRFELKTNLTLRHLVVRYDPDPEIIVTYIAINQNRDKMAIRSIPAREMGRRQELVLEPLCRIHGHCLLKEMTQSVEVGIGLESATGGYIGFLSTRRELTPEGLRVDFQVRLPPGDYLLTSGQSSHHAGFEIPVAVPAGKQELDLGTKAVSPAGTVALQGKPAPELDVQWRPGQETSWEKLRGKVVVLDFWGTWCGPCVAGMPALMEIHDQFRDKPVVWLSIHTPSVKDFDELDAGIAKCEERDWNKKKLPFTTMIDRPLAEGRYSGKTSQRYGVAEWPTLIVVDQRGRIVGPVRKNTLAATIGDLLEKEAGKKEEPVSLEGEWLAIASTSGGVARDKFNFDGMKWVMGKDSLEVFPARATPAGLAEKGTLKCTYSVDNSKSPAHFNWTIGEGEKKATVDAIYELKDGVLRVCFAQRGMARPASFETKKGESLYEFKRAPTK